MVVKIPHADLFDREHRVELVSPQVRFFNEGRAGSKVNAAQGRLDTETKDFWAGGGVVMASTDGVHLEATGCVMKRAPIGLCPRRR